MNESSQRIAAHDSHKPQDQEDHKDCPQHDSTSLLHTELVQDAP
jgi:hypothetical protein